MTVMQLSQLLSVVSVREAGLEISIPMSWGMMCRTDIPRHHHPHHAPKGDHTAPWYCIRPQLCWSHLLLTCPYSTAGSSAFLSPWVSSSLYHCRVSVFCSPGLTAHVCVSHVCPLATTLSQGHKSLMSSSSTELLHAVHTLSSHSPGTSLSHGLSSLMSSCPLSSQG